MSRTSILVIDDERRYRDLIELNLIRNGYRVALAADGKTGLNLVEREMPDLVILDLLLPDVDGYEVCRRIREYSTVPIIMLTARAEEAQKVRGLRLGADDYVTKPFGADELLARVEAVLRRTQQSAGVETPKVFAAGDLTIDFTQRRVALRGQEVRLTPLEYKLLFHLALNAGQVLVPAELLRRVWGPGYEDQDELLHTAVRRLRLKLEDDPTSPRYVLTRRGIGYRLAKPDAGRPEAA